jgi:hypothetical protein
MFVETSWPPKLHVMTMKDYRGKANEKERRRLEGMRRAMNHPYLGQKFREIIILRYRMKLAKKGNS